MNDKPSIVFIMGPSAAGKTDLAVALCGRFPFAIVSVDSAMVYRGMDIGTAKPGPDILRAAPHRLIDICDATEVYSAGRFRQDALKAIEEIRREGKIPLLVGGTGLYFRALERGISDLPGADPLIRERLEREASAIGWAALHRRLAAVDPVAAERIHPNDSQRIQRALELFEITGKTRTVLFTERRELPPSYTFRKIIIAPADRAKLSEQVTRRFLLMLKQGFIDEVRKFYERPDVHDDLPAMRMVGYRQIWHYLDGHITETQMREHAIVATRQLVKRQLTWLRSESNGAWFDAYDRELLDKTMKYLRKDTYIAGRV
jgi:tRNA dimethylallyltransferase